MQRIDSITDTYIPRGRRVPALTDRQVSNVAKLILGHLKIKANNRCDLILALESMYGNTQFPLIFDVIEDEKWTFEGIAEAIWDPRDMCISLPNSLYEKLTNGDVDALYVFLHEIGHCFLAHGLLLHRQSNSAQKKNEDAEVQADYFADSILKYLKIENEKEGKQLQLF